MYDEPTSGHYPIQIDSPMPPGFGAQQPRRRGRRRQAAALHADAAPIGPAVAAAPSGISLGPAVVSVAMVVWYVLRIAGWVVWQLLRLAVWNFSHLGRPRGWDGRGRPIW